MTPREQEIRSAVQPAIDRYLARLAEHERYSATTYEAMPVCRCGWEPPYPPRTQSANRSLGQHVARARRQAERLWKVESAEIIREMR